MWFRQFFSIEKNEIALRSHLPEPKSLLNDIRRINRALGIVEMRTLAAAIDASQKLETIDLSFTGVSFDLRTDERAVTEFLLRARIALLYAMPEYPIHWLTYARAFRRHYSRAIFRPFVIEEYEKFLSNVLALHSSLALKAEVENYSPHTTQAGLVSHFLEALFKLYLAEYHYEKAEAIMAALRERGMLHGSGVTEFFRKTNRLPEGVSFIEQTIQVYRSKNVRVDGLKNALAIAKHQRDNLKPYRARPKGKKKTPAGMLIRYER